jgi:calmodulin-regulated spectrin-associated protein
MAVIEAIMVLYAKEVVTPDRVVVAIQRFSHARATSPEPLPSDHEEGLLLWVNKACSALKRRVEQELEQGDGRGREVTSRFIQVCMLSRR